MQRTHDARTNCSTPKIAVLRPYGWACPCGAKQIKKYKTGQAALIAAKKHNGGFYNEADPNIFK